MKLRTKTAVALAALTLAGAALGQTEVAGRTYTKLATREETREKFIASLGGSNVVWGRWMVLGPFDHPAGGKDIAKPFPPEELLPLLGAGDPEPLGPLDRRRTFDGAGGKKLSWREATEAGQGGDAKRVEIDQALGVPGQRSAVAYLYRRIDAPRDMALPVKLGSDDGCRVWLNGQLIVDVNAERPFSPDSEQPTLRLKKGHNHLLVKVSQGAGEWRFGVSSDPDLDPVVESALDWQLDTDFPTSQSRFYRTATIPHAADLSLEVGGIDLLYPKGGAPRPIVCTRRGDVYVVDGAFESPPIGAKFTRYATGLQEPLGVVNVEPTNGPSRIPPGVYIAQRGELTRLEGSSGAASAVSFATVCDAWKISGNYHEYAFGPKIGPDGKMYVNLNLAHTDVDGTVMGALVDTRGCCVAIDPGTGAMEKYADGLRSPDGLVIYDGQLFYTDNQGDYVATNKLSWVRPGSFHGHQSSLKFREGYGKDWKKDGKPVPEITWPAVWFPYQKMGQSASDGVEITTDRFGPFKGQLLVGEQTLCTVNRVFLEKVKDANGADWYQGACFPFLSNFASGVHRLCFAPDGSLLVGMTDRGWGSTGPKRDGLQRVTFTGATPFEVLSMRIGPRGFMLEFTKDADLSAADFHNYAMKSYTYEYHPAYGSAEMDVKDVKIVGAQLLNPRVLALMCDGLRGGGMGYVHELKMTGLRSKDGEELLHPLAYYTVQVIPKD